MWMMDFTATAWLLECKGTSNLPVLKAVSWGVSSSPMSCHFHTKSHFVANKEEKKKGRKKKKKEKEDVGCDGFVSDSSFCWVHHA